MSVNPKKIIRSFIALIILLNLVLILLMVFVQANDYVESTGIIEEDEKFQIRNELGGIIKEVYIKNGSVVKNGDLLLKIDDMEAGLNYKRQKLQYQMQKYSFENENKDLERTYLSRKRLYNANMLTYEEFYRSKIAFENLQIRKLEIEQMGIILEVLSNNILKTDVHSIADGKAIYDENRIAKGNFVGVGEQLFFVVSYGTNNMRARIMIPENAVSKIKLSNDVKVFITAYPYTKYKAIAGTLVYLSPISENGFVRGKVELKENTIKFGKFEKAIIYGMTLNAKIIVKKKPIYKLLLGLVEE